MTHPGFAWFQAWQSLCRTEAKISRIHGSWAVPKGTGGYWRAADARAAQMQTVPLPRRACSWHSIGSHS